MNIKSACIALDRSPQRFQRVLNELPLPWPFQPLERVPAIDGRLCQAPSWWTTGNSAWGCYRSHLRLIESCLNDGTEYCFHCEDDIVCCDNFAERVQQTLDATPDDWDILYLGGQHLRPPSPVNDYVCRPSNVNRTHAFILNRKGMRKVYKHLLEIKVWPRKHHIDHQLGELTQGGGANCYAPNVWLVGQNDEPSTISGSLTPTIRFWQQPRSPDSLPFVMVVGLHRSGSSCLAGMLHHLGVHMGNVFVGCESDGGYEAEGLANLCEHQMRFPSYHKNHGVNFETQLRKWISHRQSEAVAKGTIAGGKYPHLCTFAPVVENIVQKGLMVIHIDRPLKQSIASLIRREGASQTAEVLTELQTSLDHDKRNFLGMTEAPVLAVTYEDVLESPEEVVSRLNDFLRVGASLEQEVRAARYVRPEKAHFRG